MSYSVRPLFDKYQYYLTSFANTKYGRMYLSLDKWAKIKNNYRIIKVAPDGIHFWTGEFNKKGLPICQAVFFSKSPYLKKFRLALEGLEIASNAIDKIYNPELVIPHFGGLTHVSWLPLIMRVTLTQYPDTGMPGTTSVDGILIRGHVDETWSTIRGASAALGVSNDTYLEWMMDGSVTSSKYNWLKRSIATFYTSSIRASSFIKSGTLSFYGFYKENNAGTSPNSCIYGATPTSNNNLVVGDFSKTGTTQLSDTVITYAAFSTSGYNNYSLNDAGKKNIDKAGVSKFSWKNKTYDADGGTPSWSSDLSNLKVYAADNGSNKPKLVIDYTIPAPGFYLH